MRLESLNLRTLTLFYKVSHELSDADQKPVVNEHTYIYNSFILRLKQC